MKRLIFFLACLGAIVFVAQVSPAQSILSRSKTSRHGGNAAVIVVSSAAKMAWGTTKFTAKHIAAPIAKTLFLNAAPNVAKFALKHSAKRLLPLAIKLSVL